MTWYYLPFPNRKALLKFLRALRASDVDTIHLYLVDVGKYIVICRLEGIEISNAKTLTTGELLTLTKKLHRYPHIKTNSPYRLISFLTAKINLGEFT